MPDLTSASAIIARNFFTTGAVVSVDDNGVVTWKYPFKGQYVYDVRAYGATGKGTTDDTAAIQAPIDAAEAAGGGVIFFPAGTYRCNSGLTLTASNVSFLGSGRGATLIYPYQTSGDFLYINGTGTLSRIQISDLSIYSQAEATSGALIHIDRCTRVTMSNVELSAYYGALLLESVVHSHFTNIDLCSDANFTTTRANSYLLKIAKHASGSNPSELSFANFDARGQNGNNYLSTAIWIRDLDGAFFTNVHAGFCQYPMLVQPTGDSAQVSGITMTNFFLDTALYYGLLISEPSGAYAGVFGANTFSNGHIYNTHSAGIGLDIAATAPTHLRGIDFQGIDTHGVHIMQGDDTKLADLSMHDINRDNVSGCGVLIEANVKRFTVDNVTVRQGTGTAPAAALLVTDGCDDYRVNGLQSEGCTYLSADNATTTDRAYGRCQSDLNMQTVNAGVGGALDLPQGFDAFLLGTANTVTSISTRSGWKGRQVSLVAAGSVTVNHGNNLMIGGSNINLTVNDVLTLVFNGTNWCKV